MSFWEDFFSLDKIFYAIIAAVIAGIACTSVLFLLKIEGYEDVIILFMALGFILGNVYKVQILQNIKQQPKKKI